MDATSSQFLSMWINKDTWNELQVGNILPGLKIPPEDNVLEINFYQWLNMSGEDNEQFQLPSFLLRADIDEEWDVC